MATLSIDGGQLDVKLSGWERVGALRRSDVSVPTSAVVSVKRLDNARNGIRGMRAPGTGLPGVIALGSWRKLGIVDFVAVSRSEPGYVIELQGQHFDRLVISSPPIPALDALI